MTPYSRLRAPPSPYGGEGWGARAERRAQLHPVSPEAFGVAAHGVDCRAQGRLSLPQAAITARRA